MDEKTGYPKQLEYKKLIEDSGYKKSHVAKNINIGNELLSRYINGKIYMPESVVNRLKNFLNY